ncbi:MAG TPA: glycerophosphodiester phosphodiesterase family protein [Candidatus Paceibacterota bacterium]|nr:glycerophosphodiester phosphodiesterase family protein [Candidatus Paceibacterota bacterium]
MRTWVGLLLLAMLPAGVGAELPPARNGFVVIAHRGHHARAHENTLTALREAADAGADYVEMDVRRTADGHYVLLHDSTVDRTTNGRGSVGRMTLAELRALEVRDPARPEVKPDRIPTLPEALAAVKGRIHVYLDFKEGEREEVARLIREAAVTRQVLVYDRPENVAAWRKAAPELALIVSPPPELKGPEELVAFARRLGVEALDGSWEFYSREMVSAAERAGIKVWPDIQAVREDPAYFQKVLERGFTGAQTDHPEELIAWLKKEKRR